MLWRSQPAVVISKQQRLPPGAGGGVEHVDHAAGLGGMELVEAERPEIWLLDKAPAGQTVRLCRRWYRATCARAACATSATRPPICSARSVPSGMRASPWSLPTVNAGAMEDMLDGLSQAAAADVHAVVPHGSRRLAPRQDLAIPANLTPECLAPYSPELNAIERVWLCLRERFLSHRPPVDLRRHSRCPLRRLERAARRSRPRLAVALDDPGSIVGVS